MDGASAWFSRHNPTESFATQSDRISDQLVHAVRGSFVHAHAVLGLRPAHFLQPRHFSLLVKEFTTFLPNMRQCWFEMLEHTFQEGGPEIQALLHVAAVPLGGSERLEMIERGPPCLLRVRNTYKPFGSHLEAVAAPLMLYAD